MGNKILIFPLKKRIFCPKMTKFSPKLAFLSIAGSFGARHLFTLFSTTGGIVVIGIPRAPLVPKSNMEQPFAKNDKSCLK